MENRVYPENPLVGVGAVVFKDNYILLIKRGKPPYYGMWSLPGGKVNKGETLKHAVRREIKEECSINIKVEDLIKIFELIDRDKKNKVRYHYIIFDFKALYKSGKLAHSSDAMEAEWVSVDKIKDYNLTDDVIDAINKGVNQR